MKTRLFLVAFAAFSATLLSINPSASAALILPGYDLFTTDPSGTNFGGVNFQGVPEGNYDFGGTIGIKNVGATDTIVQRLSSVTTPGATTIQLSDLRLVSQTPANFGLGVGTYYVTLQSLRNDSRYHNMSDPANGPASTGTLSINPTTFDTSAYTVNFDFRFGAINGPVASSFSQSLNSTGNPWSTTPVPGEVLVDGVNHNLNGTDTSNDFYASGTVHNGPHAVVEAVPEPSMAAFGLALLCTAGIHRRRARQA